LDENNVYLEIPPTVDPTGLVASFEEHGADVFVNDIRQISGVTPNDFTETVIFHLEGYEIADWNVYVEVVTDIPEYLFEQVLIGPNPGAGEISIENVNQLSVYIYNTLGKVIYTNHDQNQVLLHNLDPGFYFVKLEKEGVSETRKVIVN